MLASKSGNTAVVHALLEAKADLDVQNNVSENRSTLNTCRGIELNHIVLFTARSDRTNAGGCR
jgi:ankyrin repeat protein